MQKPKSVQKICIEEKGDSDKCEQTLVEQSEEFSAKKS